LGWLTGMRLSRFWGAGPGGLVSASLPYPTLTPTVKTHKGFLLVTAFTLWCLAEEAGKVLAAKAGQS